MSLFKRDSMKSEKADAPPLTKRLATEFIRTSRGLETGVGSAIMAERLAGSNVAIALLADAIAANAIP